MEGQEDKEMMEAWMHRWKVKTTGQHVGHQSDKRFYCL